MLPIGAVTQQSPCTLHQFFLLLCLKVLNNALWVTHLDIAFFKPLKNFVVYSFFMTSIRIEGDGIAIGFVVLLVEDAGEANFNIAQLILL